MDSRLPSRTVATTLLVISLVAGSAACGPTSASPNGSASPASPGATASPSASAGEIPVGTAGAAVGGAIGGISPAPSVDVAALFTKAMRDPFRANASVEGEMTIGSATYPFEGESTIDGPDNHLTVTVAIPGAPERTETMTLDGIKYVNRGGLWFEDPKAEGSGPGSDFSSVLKSVLDVTDAGVVTKGGRVPPSPEAPPGRPDPDLRHRNGRPRRRRDGDIRLLRPERWDAGGAGDERHLDRGQRVGADTRPDDARLHVLERWRPGGHRTPRAGLDDLHVEAIQVQHRASVRLGGGTEQGPDEARYPPQRRRGRRVRLPLPDLWRLAQQRHVRLRR